MHRLFSLLGLERLSLERFKWEIKHTGYVQYAGFFRAGSVTGHSCGDHTGLNIFSFNANDVASAFASLWFYSWL